MRVLFYRFLKLTPVLLLSLNLSCGGGGGGASVPPNPIASIVVTPASPTIAKGGSQQFSASARDSTGSAIPGISFTWSSSNETVARVDSNGLTQGLAEGTAIISAAANGISGATSVEVTFRIFQEPVSYPVGQTPQSAAIGDFDGDGFKDLAVANAGDNNLTILKGSSNGALSQPNNPLPTGAFPSAVASGRFSGSPYDDLAVANLGDDSISTFIGGPSGPGPGQGTALPGSGPTSIAIANFTQDNDSNNDIAVADVISGAITIIKGNGDGTFQPHEERVVQGAPIALLAADLNGDARNDLAVLLASGQVSILLGVGDGTFLPSATDLPVTFPVGQHPLAIASGDWNGDGKIDLAVVNSGSHDLTLLLGDGTGAFTSQTIPLPGGGSPNYVVSGDFDGNNKPDLAVSDEANNTVSILLNNGDGTFGSPISFPTGKGPFAMAVGRLNSDNLDDLVVVNSGDGTVSVFLQFP